MNHPRLSFINHKRAANPDLFKQAANRDAAAPLFSVPCVLHAQRNGGRPRPWHRRVVVLEQAVQWCSDVSADWVLPVLVHSWSGPQEKKTMGTGMGPERLLGYRSYNSLRYCWVPDIQSCQSTAVQCSPQGLAFRTRDPPMVDREEPTGLLYRGSLKAVAQYSMSLCSFPYRVQSRVTSGDLLRFCQERRIR